MHISVDVPLQTLADAYVSNTHPLLSINKTYPTTGAETKMRNGLVTVESGDAKGMEFISNYETFSTQVNQTYWAGFKLDSNLFNPLICFRMFMTPIDPSLTNHYEQLTFGNSVSDEIAIGFQWDYSRGIFIAPRSGYYFISLSTSLLVFQPTLSISSWFEFHVNANSTDRGEIGYVASMPPNSEDTISMSTLVSLQEQDNFTVHFYVKPNYYELHTCSLQGFLYKLQSQQQVSSTSRPCEEKFFSIM